MGIAAYCQTNDFAIGFNSNAANTSLMPNKKAIKSTKPIITHLSHKSSREGLYMALSHPWKVLLPGLNNFDSVTGSRIVMMFLH